MTADHPPVSGEPRTERLANPRRAIAIEAERAAAAMLTLAAAMEPIVEQAEAEIRRRGYQVVESGTTKFGILDQLAAIEAKERTRR